MATWAIQTEGFWSSIGDRISQGPNAPNLAFFILMVTLVVAPLLARIAHVPSVVALVLLGMAVGPHGLGILATKEIALSALGSFGLLYLMFVAGLELDLKQLAENKQAAISFALASFAIPFALGLFSARFLGYTWAAALLMGSNWGSHTLVNYPMARRMGLARTPPVATVVGATAVTDTSALLVLAAVSVTVRGSGSFLAEGTQVLFGLAILVVFCLFALPRLAHRFFAWVGTDQAQRLMFSIAALFVGAIMAEAAGIDGIVGAFFAGLGLGRAVPEESSLMDRTQFLGGALLIPIFLVSVGILLEPDVLLDAKTLLYASAFAVVVLGGKALAAALIGKRFGFSGAEIGVMSGLSGSQAAATLATTLVGVRLGLFGSLTTNAVLLVILISLVITPGMVSVFGRRTSQGQAGVERLGHKVMVPVRSGATQGLVAVAGRIAEEDGGMVVAATFCVREAEDDELAARRRLSSESQQWLAHEGLEAQALFRISGSTTQGLAETQRSEAATMLVSEWAPEGRRLDADPEAFDFISHCPVPAVLIYGWVEPFERLLVVARAEELAGPDLELAVEIAVRLRRKRSIHVVAARPVDENRLPSEPHDRLERVAARDPIGWLARNARDADLVLFSGLDAAREAMHRFPDVTRKRFLVTVAPRASGAR